MGAWYVNGCSDTKGAGDASDLKFNSVRILPLRLLVSRRTRGRAINGSHYIYNL